MNEIKMKFKESEEGIRKKREKKREEDRRGEREERLSARRKLSQ